MIDTHAHITAEYYENLEEIITDLKKLKYVINSGANLESSKEALVISKNIENMYVSVGIHPTERGSIEELEKLIENPKVKAVGEIGLDYYWKPVDEVYQKELFNNQMKLANKYSKPVVIHNREADNDVYEILSKYPGVTGVIHCFSGNKEMADKFIKLGYKIGIGGVLTFKNNKLRDVVDAIDLGDIVVETDAPYLTPEPFRGKQNNPIYVEFIYQKIAEIKGISLEKVIEQIDANAQAIFDF